MGQQSHEISKGMKFGAGALVGVHMTAQRTQARTTKMPLDQFAGSWKLISSEMRTSSGEVQYPLGENCEGRIIFDTEGNFTAQLMRPGRANFASGDLMRGSDEEIREAYLGYVAFWSKIELDEENHQFTYKVAGSLFPNWIGHSNLRYYEFDGNRVTFRTPQFVLAGTEITGVLIWERV